MLVRAGVDSDLEDVGRVHALSRNAAYVDLVPAEALGRVTPQTQTGVWRRRSSVAAGRSALLVAEVDGEIVGFTFGTAEGTAAELVALHLLPDHHGSGTGQALHDAVLEEVRSWGCAEIALWVLRGNERAQSFYRRNRWVHDGVTASHDVGGIDVPILRYGRPVTI